MSRTFHNTNEFQAVTHLNNDLDCGQEEQTWWLATCATLLEMELSLEMCVAFAKEWVMIRPALQLLLV